jgi:hypothetical protein
VTVSTTSPAAGLDLPVSVQRGFIASTPPATRWLRSHEVEDFAIFALTRGDRTLTVDRLDSPDRVTSDLTDDHIAAIRLFDRGLLTVHSYTDTDVTWMLKDMTAESDALRMLRHRTLGFLPYNMGYRQLTPDTMTGPELVALLTWHYRHTPVRRLDLTFPDADDRAGTGGTGGTAEERHADGTSRTHSFTYTRRVENFEDHTRVVHPHLDPVQNHQFDDAVLDAVFTNLTTRIADEAFGEQRLRVDLNTWRLHPYGHTPTGFTESLPLDVQDALGLLDAPTFTTRDEFVTWAEQALVMTTLCRFGDDAGMRRGGRHHTFRLDPHTHQTFTVSSNNREQAEALEAIHLLAAFDADFVHGPPPRCVAIMSAWDNSLGEVSRSKVYTWDARPGTKDNYPVRREYRATWTDMQADRVLAFHRVARMVQYLDAGLSTDEVLPVFGFEVAMVEKLLSVRPEFADGAAFAAEVLKQRKFARKARTPVTASF